mmetsp:Transcript_22465/g.36354  ORF Transcript_22465/g.36354 Transcript_22465/m.36354 type:complete len:465 (-) Transcript_22465:394-1788(-)
MANNPTLSYLLGQMAQDKEVLNGWDAALNVLEGSLNSFFQAQFSTKTSGTNQMVISDVFCGPKLSNPHGDYSVVTQFSFTLGAPSFAFTDQSNTVTVTQAIIAGSTKSGTLPVTGAFQPGSCGCTPNDSRVTWGPDTPIDIGNKPTISAKVPLTSVVGQIDPDKHTVILDFADGAFTVTNVTISGVSSGTIEDQLKSWFATNGVNYEVATLDFKAGISPPALTPTSFRLNVMVSGAGNTIVQILIVTTGTAPSGLPIVTEPIPTADGYTCTLMVSSRILFSDVLATGFNSASQNFKLYPQSSGPSDSYSAVISPRMHFSGSFSYGSCCDKHTVKYSLYLGGTYTGTATDGFYLYQSIKPAGNVHNTITVKANNPVSLSGTGASQTINIHPGTPSISVTGGASGTINSEISNILNGGFGPAMAGVSFSPVTYFALRNILFPGNLLKMSVVQAPTDLLIVGTFEPN